MPDSRAEVTLPECCQLYLQHSLDIMVKWSRDYGLDRAGLTDCLWQQRRVARPILSGKPCPWHESIPEDYVSLVGVRDAE